MAREVAAELGLKSGRIMWMEPVVGMTDMFSLKKDVPHMTEYDCCWVRSISVKKKKVQKCNVDSSLIVSSKTEFNQQTVRVPNL